MLGHPPSLQCDFRRCRGEDCSKGLTNAEKIKLFRVENGWWKKNLFAYSWALTFSTRKSYLWNDYINNLNDLAEVVKEIINYHPTIFPEKGDALKSRISFDPKYIQCESSFRGCGWGMPARTIFGLTEFEFGEFWDCFSKLSNLHS